MEAELTPVMRRPSSRRLLWIAGLAAVAIALALGWEWLTAIGLASVIISVAPCIAMCALGICMNKRPGSSCDTQSEAARTPGAKPGKQ